MGDDMTVADLKLFELLHGAWLIFFAEQEDMAKQFVQVLISSLIVLDFPCFQRLLRLNVVKSNADFPADCAALRADQRE